jgi:hypothetical protein
MGPDTQNGPCLQQCMDRFAREVNAAFKRTRLLRSVIRYARTPDPESIRMLDGGAAQSYSIVSVASGEALVDFERETQFGEIAWDSQ